MFSIGEVEAVRDFKYLGSTVKDRNEMEVEIMARIASASRSAWSLNRLLRSRRVSRRTKITIYTTMIRPIVTYGGEAWTLTHELSR